MSERDPIEAAIKAAGVSPEAITPAEMRAAVATFLRAYSGVSRKIAVEAGSRSEIGSMAELNAMLLESLANELDPPADKTPA